MDKIKKLSDLGDTVREAIKYVEKIGEKAIQKEKIALYKMQAAIYEERASEKAPTDEEEYEQIKALHRRHPRLYGVIKYQSPSSFYEYAGDYRLKAHEVGKAIVDYRKAIEVQSRDVGKDSKRTLLKKLHQARRIERKILSKRIGGSVALIGIISGLLFLSPNIAGDVINISYHTDFEVIGAILFIMGIAGALFYIRKIN